MDELKLLIEMVSNLPAMAVWVLCGFFAYKVVVVGSIYGVIRLLITKTHDWLTSPPAPKVVVYDMRGICINESTSLALTAQLARIHSSGGYLHASDVVQLSVAIDEMLQKRGKKMTEKENA